MEREFSADHRHHFFRVYHIRCPSHFRLTTQLRIAAARSRPSPTGSSQVTTYQSIAVASADMMSSPTYKSITRVTFNADECARVQINLVCSGARGDMYSLKNRRMTMRMVQGACCTLSFYAPYIDPKQSSDAIVSRVEADLDTIHSLIMYWIRTVPGFHNLDLVEWSVRPMAYSVHREYVDGEGRPVEEAATEGPGNDASAVAEDVKPAIETNPEWPSSTVYASSTLNTTKKRHAPSAIAGNPRRQSRVHKKRVTFSLK